jgi:serine protease AprX
MKPMGTDTRNDDLVASYSSKGPTAFDGIIKPDIVAPGNQTISVLSPGSTLAAEYPGNLVPPSSYGLSDPAVYLTLNGTSMDRHLKSPYRPLTKARSETDALIC